MLLCNTSVKKLLLFLLISNCLFSCKKDTGSTWNSNLLFPVFNTNLSISNIITDSLIGINKDSSIQLVYNSPLLSFFADSLIKIPDTTLAFSSKFLFTYNFLGGYSLPNIPSQSELKLNLGSAILTKAVLQSEIIHLHIENRIDSTVVFNYQIPCATLNGVAFSVFDSVSGKTGNSPAVFDRIYSLAGYSLNLTGFNGTESNVITSQMNAYVSKRVFYVTITPSDSFYISTSASSIAASYLQGYLGETTVKTGLQSSAFNLFNSIKSGSLQIPSVKVNLSIQNSIGVDAQLLINQLTSVNARTGSSINLIAPNLIGSYINVNRATNSTSSASAINSSTQSIQLTSANSNLSAFLSNLPNKFLYSMNVGINPLGNISGYHDFLYPNYGLKASMNVSIPLSLIAKNLELTDTILLNLNELKNQQKINGGNLFLYASNGFPFGAILQLYVLDQYNRVSDSLLYSGNNTISGGVLSNYGLVTQSSLSKLSIGINPLRLANLTSSKKLIVVAKFSTSSLLPVSIYDSYVLKMNLVASLNYAMSVNN